MTRQRPPHQGFSLVELLVSVAIIVAVMAGIFALMNPAHGAFQAQPELSDMQQRLRIGVDALFRDLVTAGAGAYTGAQGGSLANAFAPVLPFRQGAVNGDPAGTFKADTITLLQVPATSVQTTISEAMPAPSGDLKVNAEAGCPAGDPLCGFKAGMQVAVYDGAGFYDIFAIASVDSAALRVRHNLAALSASYGPGSRLVQIASAGYWLNAAASQLMTYDGAQTDAPVADNVVSLSFDYYGDPQPPALKKPGTDLSMTYGPQPPAPGVQANPHWPAGENCTVQMVAGEQTSRLSTLGPPGGALVRLTPAMLTDGPWCPDAATPNAYDADLLRVRKVVVTLRVQAAVAALRGATRSSLFKNPGTATASNRTLPDQEIRFEVAPRNLAPGR